MDATLVRARPLSALIVGATGRNVLRIVTAFEQRRIRTLRADTIAAACEQLVVDMPHVVLALVPAANAAEREALEDRALAVGALVVHVAHDLDDASLLKVLESTIHAALEQKLLREDAEAKVAASGRGGVTADEPNDVDDGWNDD